MINTIIFDLDGTLIDSLVDLANTVNVILTEKGYPTHTLDEYRYFVGNGVLKLLERALPADHQGDITAVKKLQQRHGLEGAEHSAEHQQPPAAKPAEQPWKEKGGGQLEGPPSQTWPGPSRHRCRPGW